MSCSNDIGINHDSNSSGTKNIVFFDFGFKRTWFFRFNKKTLCFEVLGLKLNVEKNSDPSSTHGAVINDCSL